MVNFRYLTRLFGGHFNRLFFKTSKKGPPPFSFFYPDHLHSWDIYMANISYETHKSFEKLLANTHKHSIISIVLRLFLAYTKNLNVKRWSYSRRISVFCHLFSTLLSIQCTWFPLHPFIRDWIISSLPIQLSPVWPRKAVRIVNRRINMSKHTHTKSGSCQKRLFSPGCFGT